MNTKEICQQKEHVNFGRGEDLEESPEDIQEWEPEPDDDDLDLDYDTDDYIWDKAHLYPDALTKAEKANIGLPAVIHFTRHHEEGHCPKECLYNSCFHLKNLGPMPVYLKCTSSQSLPVY